MRDVKSPSYMVVLAVTVTLAAVAMARGPAMSHPGSMSGLSSRAIPQAMPVAPSRQIPTSHPQASFSGSTFRHHHHHGNVDVFFVGGWPCWGPGWCGWWDYPPYYGYYDEGYQLSPSSATTSSYVAPENRSTDYTLGYAWGLDLRLRIVTWDQFVSAVKTFNPNAPQPSRDEFRRGFIAGYGKSADAVFDRAVKQAAPPPQEPPASAGPHT